MRLRLPTRRKPRQFNGETPGEATPGAGGVIEIPATPFPNSAGIPKYASLRAFHPELSLTGPKLGYNWELVNMHIPVYLNLEILLKEEAEPPFESLSVGLGLSVGSNNLYMFRQQLFIAEAVYNLHEAKSITVRGGWNLLFTEAPPVPLVIPGGQQLSLTFHVFELRSKSAIAGTEFPVIIAGGWGEELVKTGTTTNPLHSPESSINYVFA